MLGVTWCRRDHTSPSAQQGIGASRRSEPAIQVNTHQALVWDTWQVAREVSVYDGDSSFRFRAQISPGSSQAFGCD